MDDQKSKVDQTDFVLVKIPAKHWTYYGKNKMGMQTRLMWMPSSKRAIAWFNLAAYECNDKALQKEIQDVFSTKRLRISVVYNELTWIYCSLVKDVTVLVELLDGLERLFEIGYNKGPFKKIMSPNPSADDFWALIQCIRNESNMRVSKRFIRKFTNAMLETFNVLLDSLGDLKRVT